jgi:hypothetical protein
MERSGYCSWDVYGNHGGGVERIWGKEEGMLGCTVLEDREKGGVSTVEVYAYKEVWEDVHQKSEAFVEKNEDSTVESVVKLRDIAGWLVSGDSRGGSGCVKRTRLVAHEQKEV